MSKWVKETIVLLIILLPLILVALFANYEDFKFFVAFGFALVIAELIKKRG